MKKPNWKLWLEDKNECKFWLESYIKKRILKKSPDGTETTVATTTTDASGNYSVSGIPTATTGTGASTDFYYVVKVESGSQVAEAPVAPSGDSTANVNTVCLLI